MASGRKPIELSVGSMGVFNYALYENQVSPVRGIMIRNNTDRIVDGLSLKITSNADFMKECSVDIPPLPVGKSINIPDPDIIVDGHLLAEAMDAFSINVTVSLFRDGTEIDSETDQMKILAYNQWLGDEWAEYLPAFILPNHPVVAGLLHDASDVLKKWGKDPALEGYQTNDPNRIRDFAAAAYTAIQNKNISYANPPAHADICSPGQRIRTPETIMDQRLATCMDFTMLYAACLEAIGLNAVLCILKNHIFAGVWLKDDCSKNVITRKNGDVIKMMAKGNERVSFVECTRMQAGVLDSYDQAEYKPVHPNFDKENFDYLIDVKAARNNGIRPIASRYFQDGRYQIDIQNRSEDEMAKAPVRKDIHFTDEIKPTRGKKITNKKELWESKLLDLSNHNMLLSLPYNCEFVV